MQGVSLTTVPAGEEGLGVACDIRKLNGGAADPRDFRPHQRHPTQGDSFTLICLITEFYFSVGSERDGEKRVLCIAHLKCQQTPHLLSFFHNRPDLMSH